LCAAAATAMVVRSFRHCYGCAQRPCGHSVSSSVSLLTEKETVSPFQRLLFSVSFSVSPFQRLLFSVSFSVSPFQCLLFSVSFSVSPFQCLLFSVSFSASPFQRLLLSVSFSVSPSQCLLFSEVTVSLLMGPARLGPCAYSLSRRCQDAGRVCTHIRGHGVRTPTYSYARIRTRHVFPASGPCVSVPAVPPASRAAARTSPRAPVFDSVSGSDVLGI
jgi:hypothetical protein